MNDVKKEQHTKQSRFVVIVVAFVAVVAAFSSIYIFLDDIKYRWNNDKVLCVGVLVF